MIVDSIGDILTNDQKKIRRYDLDGSEADGEGINTAAQADGLPW